MDNGQMPPVMPVPPTQPMQSVSMAPNGMPMVQQVPVMPGKKKDTSGLIKTIAIVVLSLVTVTFIGLFIWMFMQYNEAQSNLDYKIDSAVAEAKLEQRNVDEEEYAEREKNPYKTFAGPADYGQLTFDYPRTWSVYVAEDALEGGDFKAYFNPIQVDPVSDNTINALRLTIRDKSYEDVVAEYQKIVDKKDSNLSVTSVEIGNESKGVKVPANRYTGTLPNTDLSGYIVIFKIRDKTVILQTDSVLFEKDFDELLKTIVFNS